jgi:hypothetical protein
VLGVEWTIEDHLRAKPAAAVQMYHRFIELVEQCGPFTLAVAKTTITLKGTRRGFAGARPTARGLLAGYFDLQRQVQDPRIIRVSPYTARLFVHQFRVSSIGELDDGFRELLCEAYQVGAGAHVSRNT